MTLFADAWRRVRARAYGRLKGSRLASELVARLLLVRALLPGTPAPTRLAALATACRRTRAPALRRVLRRRLAPSLTPRGAAAHWRAGQVGLARYYQGFGGLEKKALTTSLLLKAPGPDGEKGVLYSSFEYNWMRLVHHHDARAFFERYYLVGASSGSPPDYAAFAHLAGLSADPVFIGVSNQADLDLEQVMAPTVRALPLMACDWIDPADYCPKPAAEREIDIVMVANWMRFKRHWLLFEALRAMPRQLRVVLIGRNGEGRTAETLRAEARSFGVRQELEFHTNIPYAEITRHQCNARIALLFSFREGSCVAPVEAMFADTPVGMMRDGHVGSKAHINAQTGVLLERRGLAWQLMRFLEERERFAPRAWATAHISCHHSSRRLNAVLRAHALATGAPWTRDIAPLCWRYVPAYVHPEDEAALAPAVAALRDTLGVELVKFQYRQP